MTENSVKYRTNIRNYLLVTKINIKGLHEITRMQNSTHITNTLKTQNELKDIIQLMKDML